MTRERRYLAGNGDAAAGRSTLSPPQRGSGSPAARSTHASQFAARQEGLDMQTLDLADGARIAYTDAGTGRPLVFVHGWTLNQAMWDYHVHRLSGSARCVTYDRRGHGQSSVPDGGYDADTLADDLAAMLDHLDLREVTLVSHSMGSVEVARYLGRHGSARIRGAVLIAPTSPMSAYADDNPAGLTGEQIDAAVDALADDRPHWFRSQQDAYFALPGQAHRTSGAMVEATLRQCLETPLPVQVACLRTMLTTDLRHDLRDVEVPVVVIHGSLDRSTPLESCGRP